MRFWPAKVLIGLRTSWDEGQFGDKNEMAAISTIYERAPIGASNRCPDIVAALSCSCPDVIDVARSRWTKPRIARAVFLAARGHDARDIASDALVLSTAASVRDVLRRVGVALSDVPRGDLMASLGARLARFAKEAQARQETPEHLASRVLRILADDPTLLANVLDDEG